MDFVAYFEEQIRIQHQAIRSFKWTVVALLILGASVILFSLASKNSSASDMIKLGAGLFTAALATFPYKEIAPRRERIACYVHLKTNFEKAEQLTPEVKQQITQIAIDAIKENLKR